MSSPTAQSIIKTNHLYMPVIKKCKLKEIELHTSVPISARWIEDLHLKGITKSAFLLNPSLLEKTQWKLNLLR